MSWHKEFLSENNKKPSISSMDDLYSLIAEVYEVSKDRLVETHKTEMELLREQFINERKDMSLTLQAIPEISVTELGWTDVRTTGGQKVSGPERQQLRQFLEQIEGASLQEKVASLSAFYTNGPSEDYDNLPVGRKIAKVLSYLVFFKALTKVVSNFNAASAGFNFEAFLAVLLDGRQVPANTGTIADFTTGDQIPISLKLYNEKSVVVGGSFNDLVGDLVEPQFSGFDGMRYVVCMKSFTSSETGEKQGAGLDIEGDIKFFQFDFTLDNIADIIARSMDKSKICIQLPAAFIASKGKRDVASELPGANLPSPEELETKFVEFFMEDVVARLDGIAEVGEGEIGRFLEELDWASNDSLFTPVGKGDVQKKVVRGQSKIKGGPSNGNPQAKAMVLALAEDGVFGTPTENPRVFRATVTALAKAFAVSTVVANEQIRALFATARVKSEREQSLRQPGFYASLEDSVNFYNSLKDSQMKKRALLNTKGMLETYQFDVNRRQVLEISQDLGTIKIGARIVQEMLNKMTTDLNEAIFDIFMNVKAIQDNTYSFMAGGLQEDEKATASIKAANAIAYKTEELRPEAATE